MGCVAGSSFLVAQGISPEMATGQSGNLCLIMNLRVVPEAVKEDAACKTLAPAIAA
jgi:hypothetical protein